MDLYQGSDDLEVPGNHGQVEWGLIAFCYDSLQGCSPFNQVVDNLNIVRWIIGGEVQWRLVVFRASDKNVSSPAEEQVHPAGVSGVDDGVDWGHPIVIFGIDQAADAPRAIDMIHQEAEDFGVGLQGTNVENILPFIVLSITASWTLSKKSVDSGDIVNFYSIVNWTGFTVN